MTFFISEKRCLAPLNKLKRFLVLSNAGPLSKGSPASDKFSISCPTIKLLRHSGTHSFEWRFIESLICMAFLVCGMKSRVNS